jgi:hypothetical protein
MPEVMLLKGGIVVPTGVVGTGELDVKEEDPEIAEEEPAGVLAGAAVEEDELTAAFCFFTRRACRSLVAFTAPSSDKRATRVCSCMTEGT